MNKNSQMILDVIDLHKNYEGKPLLKGIDFQVANGEIFCLLGRSGSGKSTLLRIIAGLESADQGQVLWNGQNMNGVPTYLRSFGLMFQDYALFPHMNVYENVSFGLRMQKIPDGKIKKIVSQALDLVNMSGFEDRQVTLLSGGEQQRIALARALAPNPGLLMLDEPLAALDRALRMELQEELRSLLHKTGIPAIYVTHDQEEALVLGDRVAVLADGVIEQMGIPEEVYRSPKNRKVAQFFGMTNFIEGTVLSVNPLTIGTAAGILPVGICHRQSNRPGDKVLLLLCSAGAQLVRLQEKSRTINGRVSACIFRGNDYKISLQIEKLESMAFFFSEPCAIGEIVDLWLPDHSIICLDEELKTA